VSNLPLPIQAILPAIAADQGRLRGDTLLAVLGPEPAEIRRHLPAIDAALGSQSPGLADLAALVTTAEHAVSSSQPTVPNQHYISRVVLRQFTETVMPAGRVLARFDLRNGKYLGPTGAGGVGNVRDFVPVDSQTTEDLWQKVETALPGAMAAALTGTALGSPAHLETLRRVVALHVVRHPQTVTAHNDAFSQAVENQIHRLGDTRLAEEAFWRNHGGLYAAGPEGRRLGLEASQGRLRRLHEAGALFRISVQRLYEKVCDRFDSIGVEILTLSSPTKEFLIGDVPAVTYQKATGALGLANGVAVDVADKIIMPLGPRLAVVVGQPTASRSITDDEVDLLNKRQVHVARDVIFHRPAMNFAASIAAWRSTD
jgi:hypothetical protein